MKSGTPVTITVLKNPFQTCTADSKTEILKPEADPLASILGIAFALVGGARGDCAKTVDPPAGTPDGAAIETQLVRVNAEITRTVQLLHQARNDYSNLATKVQALAKCETASNCQNAASAAKAVHEMAQEIRSKLDQPPEVPATVGAEVDALSKALVGSGLWVETYLLP